MDPRTVLIELRRRRAAEAAAQLPVRTRARTAATTGELPIARTRGTVEGPTGTAAIPVQPRGADERPLPPVGSPRRRLRTPPPAADSAAVERAARPAPPRARGPVRTSPGALQPTPSWPATRPLPVVPPTVAPPPTASLTAPALLAAPRRPATGPVRALPAVPPPSDPTGDVDAPPRGPRRPFRALVASLAALGLAACWALPSIGAEGLDAPPVKGVHLGDDLQQFQVGSDVDGTAPESDPMTGSLPSAGPNWIVPIRGELRDGFGPRLAQPVAGVSLFHRGQDIGGPCGAPIHAAAAGVVESAGWWGTYGNWTLIAHGNGVETGYAHQVRIVVHVGEHVDAGQVIGYEGSTGASTGCHLHLEVHLNSVAVNPVPFFAAKGVPLGR